MKYLLFAALTALAVSACTTVKNTPVSSDIKTVESMPQKIPTDDTSVTAGGVIQDSTDHNLSHAASDHSSETLLYGAMTKYELMRFVELISTGGQQAALEQDNIVTVFAPNNSAFEYANLSTQTDISGFLRDHMIAGRFDLQALETAVSENGGPVTLQTLSGQSMIVYFMDGKVKLSGADGVLATITQSDMMHSNGVMHQINHVIVR